MTTRHGFLALTLACGFAVAGCGAPSKNPASNRPVNPAPATQPAPAASTEKLTISAPCPTRLHDICGPLLIYLESNYRLPERIEELQQMPGFAGIGDFACPTSNQPYVYNRTGVIGANVSQRAVLYDSRPSHAGYRWAIVVREATPNAPFIVDVVAWPESRFPKTVAP